MPVPVPPCRRVLPGLSPAQWHAPGLPSPGTADTNQTRRIRHFGCRQSHTKPVSFYSGSAPSDHPLGRPPAAVSPSIMHGAGASALALGLWQ